MNCSKNMTDFFTSIATELRSVLPGFGRRINADPRSRGSALSRISHACVCAAVLFAMPAMAVDVQVSRLEDTPDPAVRGGIITYGIDVQNQAADIADNVGLSFPLPNNTVFEAVDNGDC